MSISVLLLVNHLVGWFYHQMPLKKEDPLYILSTGMFDIGMFDMFLRWKNKYHVSLCVESTDSQ